MQKKRKRSRQGSSAPAKMPSSSHVYPLDPSSALVVTGEDDGPESPVQVPPQGMARHTAMGGNPCHSACSFG